MADTDTPATDTPVKKPARRRATTPAKAAATAKPRSPRVKATPASEPASPAKAPAKAPPKPRSSKRSGSPATARKATTRQKAEIAASKVGGKWGIAAIAGGLAAAGAATAALLSLRNSSAKPDDPAKPNPDTSPGKTNTGQRAHQPDGTDASASFDAGIADENTIPS